MELKLRKCGSCNIETNKGKFWRTGTWLCDKCFDEWKLKDSLYKSDTSVSKSVIKKIKKGRKRNLKIVKTKLHEDGFQSRLNVVFE